MNQLSCCKLLFACTFLLFTQCVTSQTTAPAAPGTYQFRCPDIKKPLDVFTTELLYVIEAQRDSLLEKTIAVGPYMLVRIPPYCVINAPGFVPFPAEPVFERLSPDIYNVPESIDGIGEK